MSKSPRRRCGPLAPLPALPDLSLTLGPALYLLGEPGPSAPPSRRPHPPSAWHAIPPPAKFVLRDPVPRCPLPTRARGTQTAAQSPKSPSPGRWQSSWCKCRVNLTTVPSGETGQDSLTPNLAIWSPLAPALTSLPVPAAQEKAAGHTPLPSTAPTSPLPLGQSGSKDLLLSKSRV